MLSHVFLEVLHFSLATVMVPSVLPKRESAGNYPEGTSRGRVQVLLVFAHSIEIACSAVEVVRIPGDRSPLLILLVQVVVFEPLNLMIMTDGG